MDGLRKAIIAGNGRARQGGFMTIGGSRLHAQPGSGYAKRPAPLSKCRIFCILDSITGVPFFDKFFDKRDFDKFPSDQD